MTAPYLLIESETRKDPLILRLPLTVESIEQALAQYNEAETGS